MITHPRNNNPFQSIVKKLTNEILFKTMYIILANPPTPDSDKELRSSLKISSMWPFYSSQQWITPVPSHAILHWCGDKCQWATDETSLHNCIIASRTGNNIPLAFFHLKLFLFEIIFLFKTKLCSRLI